MHLRLIKAQEENFYEKFYNPLRRSNSLASACGVRKSGSGS